MHESEKSPQITQVSWGRMDVEGLGTGRDWKLYPGGGREWDWSETGTHHEPGIQPEDVAELLEHNVAVVVLSRGMELRLRACPETLELLRSQGIETYVEETSAAVSTYNKLAVGHAVGGLFHTTC